MAASERKTNASSTTPSLATTPFGLKAIFLMAIATVPLFLFALLFADRFMVYGQTVFGLAAKIAIFIDMAGVLIVAGAIFWRVVWLRWALLVFGGISATNAIADYLHVLILPRGGFGFSTLDAFYVVLILQSLLLVQYVTARWNFLGKNLPSALAKAEKPFAILYILLGISIMVLGNLPLIYALVRTSGAP